MSLKSDSTSLLINSFHANFLFSSIMKASENQTLSDIFRMNKKGTLTWNEWTKTNFFLFLYVATTIEWISLIHHTNYIYLFIFYIAFIKRFLWILKYSTPIKVVNESMFHILSNVKPKPGMICWKSVCENTKLILSKKFHNLLPYCSWDFI